MASSVHGSTVLYPCDANQTARLVGLMVEREGISYLRTTREKTPILYTDRLDEFHIGGSRIVRGGEPGDAVAVITAGITVHEAIKAADQLKATIKVRVIDAYSVKPLDAVALVEAVRATGGRLCVVEDHWAEGGLGDAVLAALAETGLAGEIVGFRHLAVRVMPTSSVTIPGSPKAVKFFFIGQHSSTVRYSRRRSTRRWRTLRRGCARNQEC